MEVGVDCGRGQGFGMMVCFSWAVGLGEGTEGMAGGETGASSSMLGLFMLELQGVDSG